MNRILRISLWPVLLILPACALAEAGPRLAAIGTGEIRTAPDQADITLRIEATRPRTRDAMVAAQAAVRAAYAVCSRYASDSTDLGAGRMSVEREYRWIKNTQVLQGMQASQNVTLRLKDLGRLGFLIEEAAALKGTRLEAIDYSHGSRDSLECAAETKALLNARRSAEGIAAGLGRRLGEPLEVRNYPPGMDRPGNGGMDDLGFATRAASESKKFGSANGYLVTPDQIVVQALVTVVYALAEPVKP